jgi:predicted nucleic acid-binding protein
VIVVSDTSPITNLITIDRPELLEVLFGAVLVPPVVHQELRRHHTSLPGFVRVTELTDRDRSDRFAAELDPGESEAIALSIELKPDFLLIDEKLGRAVAERNGIRTIGLLGVLLLAKKRGFVSSLRDVVDQLTREAGFFVSADVRSQVLRSAGEA